jgi:hypothetical protein
MLSIRTTEDVDARRRRRWQQPLYGRRKSSRRHRLGPNRLHPSRSSPGQLWLEVAMAGRSMPGHGLSRAGHRPTDRAGIGIWEHLRVSNPTTSNGHRAPRIGQGLGEPSSLRPDNVERRHRQHEERCSIHPSRSSPGQLWSEFAVAGRSMPGHGPNRAGHRLTDRAGIGSTSESPTRRRRTAAPAARRTLREKILSDNEKIRRTVIFTYQWHWWII